MIINRVILVWIMHIKNFTKFNRSYNQAFTLAEVMITLLIIGIVAVIVMTGLIANINQRVLNERINNVEFKFTQATTKMVAAGNMDQFINTLAFVKALEKHYTIAKICTANQLRGCWSYDSVTLDNGKLWDISKTISGNELQMEKNEAQDYSGQTVGIVIADGTTMILAYNTKCPTFDPSKTYPYNGFTNATTACVAAIFDANGSKKPNTVGKDVVLFNAVGLGNLIPTASISCSKYGGYVPCAGSKIETALTDATASEYLGINNGGAELYSYYAASSDGKKMSWGLAYKTCNDLGLRLPDASELHSMY